METLVFSAVVFWLVIIPAAFFLVPFFQAGYMIVDGIKNTEVTEEQMKKHREAVARVKS